MYYPADSHLTYAIKKAAAQCGGGKQFSRKSALSAETLMRLLIGAEGGCLDMKNHIAVLTQLAAGVEGHDELRAYLSELGQASEQLDARFSTGLAAIDALLGGKEREARERLGEAFSLRAERILAG